jgi:hypothetical protein
VALWLSSISSLASNQIVYLVGTHTDGICDAALQEISTQLKNMVLDWKSSFEVKLKFIDDTARQLFFWPIAKSVGVDRLREHIVEQTNNMKFDQVPGSYLQLMARVSSARMELQVPVMAWRDFEELGRSVGLVGESLRDAATMLHAWGEILYYDKHIHLSQRVILEPRWLIQVFKSVISFKHTKSDFITKSELIRYVDVLSNALTATAKVYRTDLQVSLGACLMRNVDDGRNTSGARMPSTCWSCSPIPLVCCYTTTVPTSSRIVAHRSIINTTCCSTIRAVCDICIRPLSRYRSMAGRCNRRATCSSCFACIDSHACHRECSIDCWHRCSHNPPLPTT